MNKHYIRINDKKHVTFVFSNAFEKPQDNDIFIKDGGRHYNLNIFREDGLYNYKYINGKLVETTDADLVNELQLIANENRILEIKEELKSVDYKTIKRLQGHYTDSEWITHVAYCDALRDEMNGLQ
jgi:hypothetical protein